MSRICLICHGTVTDDGPARSCKVCGAPYHPDCWAFNLERCGRYGCGGLDPEMSSDHIIIWLTGREALYPPWTVQASSRWRPRASGLFELSLLGVALASSAAFGLALFLVMLFVCAPLVLMLWQVQEVREEENHLIVAYPLWERWFERSDVVELSREAGGAMRLVLRDGEQVLSDHEGVPPPPGGIFPGL